MKDFQLIYIKKISKKYKDFQDLQITIDSS